MRYLHAVRIVEELLTRPREMVDSRVGLPRRLRGRWKAVGSWGAGLNGVPVGVWSCLEALARLSSSSFVECLRERLMGIGGIVGAIGLPPA